MPFGSGVLTLKYLLKKALVSLLVELARRGGESSRANVNVRDVSASEKNLGTGTLVKWCAKMVLLILLEI